MSCSVSAYTASTASIKSHAALSPSNHHQGQPPPGSADSVWRWQRLWFLSLPQVLYFWTEWTAGGPWERGQIALALIYSAQSAVSSPVAGSQELTMPCPECNVLNINRTEKLMVPDRQRSFTLLSAHVPWIISVSGLKRKNMVWYVPLVLIFFALDFPHRRRSIRLRFD